MPRSLLCVDPKHIYGPVLSVRPALGRVQRQNVRKLRCPRSSSSSLSSASSDLQLAFLMAHTFTGFFDVTTLNETEPTHLALLESISAYRKAPKCPTTRLSYKSWYSTTLGTDALAPKLGIICVDGKVPKDEKPFLHTLCFCTGDLSFGMASHAHVRFLLEARIFTTLDDPEKLRNIPPMITSTGLGRSVYSLDRELTHEFFITSPCIYSGIQNVTRVMCVLP